MSKLKDPIFWLKIIKEVLELILAGVEKGKAAAMIGAKHGVSATSILKRMK
ncbi:MULTISPECIES: hypothetical protein [Bacillus cereus group]|uniref:hypothetical protein n=1 Tax=Bacillus cereus group TaxID=86661 RepID=UPI0016426EA3|nr:MULTISPECIES: hypothetical protein [Bacillus cereus group]MCU5577850.1 hypothetical protein [Bacillus wiedmannii]WMS85254.1 hypothetical protein RE438_28915 [Bacillus wiedmannii]HDR7677142.1 hypothetical protein [Bacillus wiedmannii]